MARYVDLLPDVANDVKRAPDISIEKALRRSAIEFFGQSDVWQALCAALALRDGIQRYELDSEETGGRVLRPADRYAYVNGETRRISVIPARQVFFKDTATTGDPRVVGTFPASNEIIVWPVPSADVEADGKTLQMQCAHVPTDTGTSIPDRLLNMFGEEIVYGAKWRMMRQPDQPWTDAAGADMYRKLYYRGINRAQREANRQGTFGNQRVQPHPFV